eukprot:GHUV01022477.1.p2 GENE.GHUV01022477.1~~GHUV01022477.1.p2  ORF type:complete len:106 (+),score=20.09 GHUV01022477.1:370-687(+)
MHLDVYTIHTHMAPFVCSHSDQHILSVVCAGNSVPDLMNNMSLARDGFPSMAVAACFAGPMFSMMVGMSAALAYGAAANHGVLHVPVVSVSASGAATNVLLIKSQ